MSRFLIILFSLSLVLSSCIDGDLYTPGNEFVQEEEDYPPVFIFKTDSITVNYSKNDPFATISDSIATASTLVVDKRGEAGGNGDFFIMSYTDKEWTEGSFTEVDGVQINYTIDSVLYHNFNVDGSRLPINVSITGIEEVAIVKDTFNVMHGNFSATLQTEDGLKEIIITEGTFKNVPIL